MSDLYARLHLSRDAQYHTDTGRDLRRKAAQYKAMEAQTRVRDTEAFKHLEASGAFKTAGDVKDKVLRELKQVRDGVRDGLR